MAKTAITTPAVTGTPNEDDGIAANGASGNDFPSGKTYRFRYDTANPDPLLRDNLLGATYPHEVATVGHVAPRSSATATGTS